MLKLSFSRGNSLGSVMKTRVGTTVRYLRGSLALHVKDDAMLLWRLSATLSGDEVCRLTRDGFDKCSEELFGVRLWLSDEVFSGPSALPPKLLFKGDTSSSSCLLVVSTTRHDGPSLLRATVMPASSWTEATSKSGLWLCTKG